MATVRPKRNVLILKGDLSPNLILGLLDSLCDKIQERKKLKYAPQPWHLFSFICASGRYSSLLAICLDPARQSTQECRELLDRIHAALPSLRTYPSDLRSLAVQWSLQKHLKERFNETDNTDSRCEVFTWNARNADEAPNDIRTHKQKTSLLSSVEASLHVEVYAPAKHPGAVDVHPMFALHNLVQEAETRIDLHNDRYVSIRVRPQDSREEESEKDTLQNMRKTHFAVVVDASQPIHVQLEKNPMLEEMLEAAASDLSEWLAEDTQQGNQNICTASLGKQKELDSPFSEA